MDPRKEGGVAALLLAVVLLVTLAAECRADPPAHRSLAGRLLVATESLRDPRFARTVVYMVRHDPDGAIGLVINVPVAEVSFERALRPFGLEVPPGSGHVQVHYGGPVAEQRGLVLHTADWVGDGTTILGGGFALTADPGILLAMARGAGPRRALFLLGHAAWAPGQLDAELATGAWGVALADERLVFDEDAAQKWIEAMARRRLDL
jgi:putative transcriptional regulator